jgi:hypothetical protein
MPTIHAKMSFKAFRFCIIFAATVAGCGGGGGGDDQESVPEICRSYCSFICTRAANCGYFPASEVAVCDDTCVSTIASNGGTAAACDQRGAEVAAANCSQIGSMIGLRSLSKAGDTNSANEQENNQAIAAHSGAELGMSVTQ